MTDPFDEDDDLRTFYEQINSIQILNVSNSRKNGAHSWKDVVKLSVEVNNHRYLIQRIEENTHDIGLEQQSIIGFNTPVKYQVFVIALLYITTGYRPDCFEE